MVRFACLMFAVAGIAAPAFAQNHCPPSYRSGDYYGAASVGSSEPLFSYDDQEPWKHGYLQVMPYYGGHHAFLPYNYKAVFAQSQVAAGWGMPNVMPYSQQFWHRYEQQADLSQPLMSPVQQPGYLPPTSAPQQWYAPTSQVVPERVAIPTGYAAPIEESRGARRGPRLP